MGNFNKFVIASAMTAFTVAGAMAAPFGPRHFDIGKHAWRHASKSATMAFNTDRMEQIRKNNEMLMGRAPMKTISPDITFDANDKIGDLDGPNGELWFYTANYVYKTITHEGYEEKVLLEYTFRIFDANAREVGVIHDKVRYDEYEVRTVQCDLVEFISKHQFNSDDNYEVMIGFAFNRTSVDDKGETHYMNNSYRNLVYSLGGETEMVTMETPEGDTVTKEVSKPVYRLEGTVGDVVNASTADKESFFITMYDEALPEPDYDDILGDISGEETDTNTDKDNNFWEELTNAHITLRVLGKVDAEGNMPELLKYEIPTLKMPGDQEDTLPMFSISDGEDSFLLVQHYKEYFYNRYDSPTDDMSMREHNSLVIDIYRFKDGTITKSSTTEIPVIKDSGDRLLSTFYSVCDMRYKEDVYFTEDGKPGFFVTKTNYFADESEESSYHHYDSEGKKLNDFFIKADSHLAMSHIEGFEPQHMFVSYANGEYVFHFVDLLSGKEVTKFSCYLEIDPDSDPDMLTSNIDRVKVGDTYEYAVEMRTPTLDDNDNTINRYAWFDKSGKYLRTEEVNMGQNVLYAQSYLDTYTLQPELILKDSHREYMMLVKRAIDANTKSEELLIGQALNPEAPEGKDVLLITPDERGVLANINPFTMLDKPMLHVYFYDQPTGKMSLDIYYLPFDGSKVEEIEAAGSGAALTFDGTTLYGEGEIKVFNISGMQVKSGNGTLSVADLDGGIYVALCGKDVRKFSVK